MHEFLGTKTTLTSAGGIQFEFFHQDKFAIDDALQFVGRSNVKLSEIVSQGKIQKTADATVRALEVIVPVVGQSGPIGKARIALFLEDKGVAAG